MIRGKLATGVRCGEAMPARAKVRITSTCLDPVPYACGSRTHDLVVHRSTKSSVANEHTYPAPYAPSCCTDQSCDEANVPYLADGFETQKTILAVWPENADIGLIHSTARAPGLHDCVAPPFGHGCYVLATFDFDGGHRERLVYDAAVNDF